MNFLVFSVIFIQRSVYDGKFIFGSYLHMFPNVVKLIGIIFYKLFGYGYDKRTSVPFVYGTTRRFHYGKFTEESYAYVFHIVV